MTRDFGGRPMGEVSLRTLELATKQDITAVSVAQTLQLSRRDASVTVYSLAARGHLTEVDRLQVEGARRPVPVYRAAAEPAAALAAPWLLLLDWPRGY